MNRKTKVFLTIIVLAVIVSVAGIVLSSKIKSPAAIAAETAPPNPTLITSPIRRQVLVNNLIFRGNFAEQHVMDITASGPSGVTSPVITKLYSHNW